MRAAHSLKGAARIVGLIAGVGVAHAMEDCFVAAQRGGILLRHRHIERLLHGVDLLGRIAKTPERDVDTWTEESKKSEVDAFLSELPRLVAGEDDVEAPEVDAPPLPASVPVETQPAVPHGSVVAGLSDPERSDRVLRVTAEHLNSLLGLAA